MAVAAQDLVLRYLVKPHDLLELKRFNPGDRVTGFVDLCLDGSVDLRVVRICAKSFRRRKHASEKHTHVGTEKVGARAHAFSSWNRWSGLTLILMPDGRLSVTLADAHP